MEVGLPMCCFERIIFGAADSVAAFTASGDVGSTIPLVNIDLYTMMSSYTSRAFLPTLKYST